MFWNRKGRSCLNKTESIPNEASLRSVDEMPAVGSIVFPADILWVVPQSAHLKDIVKPSIILSTKTDSTALNHRDLLDSLLLVMARKVKSVRTNKSERRVHLLLSVACVP